MHADALVQRWRMRAACIWRALWLNTSHLIAAAGAPEVNDNGTPDRAEYRGANEYDGHGSTGDNAVTTVPTRICKFSRANKFEGRRFETTT